MGLGYSSVIQYLPSMCEALDLKKIDYDLLNIIYNWHYLNIIVYIMLTIIIMYIILNTTYSRYILFVDFIGITYIVGSEKRKRSQGFYIWSLSSS
jgi:hypothetical protein